MIVASCSGPFGLAALERMTVTGFRTKMIGPVVLPSVRLPTLTREERAIQAKVGITANFGAKQQAFLDFVLSHYVQEGVQELDQEKLTPLLRLKYHDSIADATA